MSIEQTARRSLNRNLWITIALIGIAIIDTAIWRNAPSYYTASFMLLGWFCAWFNVNSTLALTQRLELIAAVPMNDIESINGIGRWTCASTSGG